MVVSLRVAVRVIVSSCREFCSNDALELTAPGNIRDKGHNILAGGRFADTLEDVVRRVSRETEAILRTSAPLGTLEEVA